MARKKSNTTTPLESLKHKDKRPNIPTEELRNMVTFWLKKNHPELIQE